MRNGFFTEDILLHDVVLVNAAAGCECQLSIGRWGSDPHRAQYIQYVLIARVDAIKDQCNDYALPTGATFFGCASPEFGLRLDNVSDIHHHAM